MSDTARPLIPASTCSGARGDVTVLDVRYRLGGPPGRPEYAAGHVPGAAYVDLDTDLAGAAGHARPAPAARPRRFLAAMRRAGVGSDRPVVVYDDWDGPGRGPVLVAAAPPRPRRRAGARRRLAGVAGRGRRGRDRARRAREPRRLRRPAPGAMPVVDGRRRRSAWPCWSTPARRSATAARPSRSTRSPGSIPGAVNVPTDRQPRRGRPLPAGRELREVYAAVGADRRRRRGGVLRLRRHRRPRPARAGGRRRPRGALPRQLDGVGRRPTAPGRDRRRA